MTKSAAALISAILCLLPAAGFAGPLEDGQAAYDRGDYTGALKLWRPSAEKGEAEAQKALGWLYATGHGVTQDYAAAGSWYRKAADQGLAEAEFNLGVLYEHGVGVEKDYAEALKWYGKAAAQEDAAAQDNLGWMYQYGWGTKLDYVEAYKWYSLAAKADDKEESRAARADGAELAAKMTPAQLREAKQRALEWKPAPPTPAQP